MEVLYLVACLLLGVAGAPQPSDVTFYLYTRNTIDSHQVIEELGSLPHFDRQKHTYFLIHGWEDSYSADVNVHLKAALLEKYDANVIVVDWSPVASMDYISVFGTIPEIGAIVGGFLDDLMDAFSLGGSGVTLIGHSFGAHVAGVAGSTLKRKVGQIIGTDPAGLLFSEGNTANRLDPTDAEYVQVIHTNGRLIGFSSPLGTVDYYPNGGQVQAGCGLDLLGTCSHDRAWRYLVEAIRGGHFTATLCGSYNDYEKHHCEENRHTEMGTIDVDRSVAGNYYLKTNSATPFAKG